MATEENEVWGSREDYLRLLTVLEIDGGFDGMLPDPVSQANLFDRIEQDDLRSPRQCIAVDCVSP